jgi:hypothetical protein
LEQFRLGVLCFSVVAAMPRAAVAVEETMVEAQLVVTKPLKFKVSEQLMPKQNIWFCPQTLKTAGVSKHFR